MNRPEILERVRNRTRPWDIIVIGGGATGVGCALDAASRGLDVLLLEQHDFGKGTSSRSTKLVHGGVRYLAQGNISLVREALKERGILLRNAPHVVHKQAFIVPCYSLWQKAFYGTGLKIYDLLSGKNTFGRSRILSKRETVDMLPTIKTKNLSGGVLYYDGQFDDTRLLIDLARTAHAHGGAVLNYSKVRTLTKNADGKVNGVEFEDVASGESFSVTAKVVINATGAFSDAVRKMSDAQSEPIITLSQGIHLVFDRKFLPGDGALMIPKTTDGRVLFCIPWHGHTLVGTTDTSIGQADLEPHALAKEVDFVLETAAAYLKRKPTRADILSVFAGIRPLVKSGAARNTATLSRGHTIEIDRAGLLTITGGKWTTYRHMAEDAVDQAVSLASLEAGRSITETLPILAQTVAKSENDARLHPDLPYNADDVIRAARDEMAQTVEDVLARRTRALFLNAKVAIEIAPKVAEIMSDELGKDEDWAGNQVAAFLSVAEAYKLP
ncbi:MAG: glycerol-3-phosphate dehydrogenase/oxidase [Acidobacteriota bacterium]